MNRPAFHTITFGCKLNQFDSAAIEGELRRRGFDRVADPAHADVVVVNTCTVTHRADADARKRIRAVRRANPACKLLVTGCYAELDPQGLLALGAVDRVFGNRDKPRLPAILDEMGLAGAARPAGDRGCDASLESPAPLHFGERSRAFLKIQDGCRLVCSYCIIPTVRGSSRSVAPGDVVRSALRLIADGYREIVLTGVNTGDWGRDLDPPSELSDLLECLLAEIGPNRIRLNSLEPLTLTPRIIELMAGDPRLAPHLQVPLQSAAPQVLRAMRRNYRPEQYLEQISRLTAAVPHAGVGADVIVGFPGETDQMFENTLDFVERSPLSYLHVFSWSPRPGTPASAMPERVPSRVIRGRSTRLRALGRRLALGFRKRFVGCGLDAVALGPPSRDGVQRVLSGNFIELNTTGSSAVTPGSFVRVEVERVDSERTWGRAVGRPNWAG